jgi:hypothetical protein
MNPDPPVTRTVLIVTSLVFGLLRVRACSPEIRG